MTELKHKDLIKQGLEAWNQWRRDNPEVKPRLAAADLRRCELQAYDLHDAELVAANLERADLEAANLAGADLRGANLQGANLNSADLSGADLESALLSRASLGGATLRRANLSYAVLGSAILFYTNLEKANLTGAKVYGISVWNTKLTGAIQKDLIITHRLEPVLTVDNLELAQLMHLLLESKNIRELINATTSKLALILGRFTEERKRILEAIRRELRRRDYAPVIFDFQKPARQTTLETISTLAHLARFIIADVTDAKSVLQELQSIVPANPSVPVQILLLASQQEPGMFDFFQSFPWVLDTFRYGSLDELLTSFDEKVIRPVEGRAAQRIAEPVSPPRKSTRRTARRKQRA